MRVTATMRIMGQPPYRDYLPEPGDPPDPARPIGTDPRPGHGVVYVTVDRNGTWFGSWQDDGPELNIADIEGTQPEVMAWAQLQAAPVKWVQDPVTGESLPLG